MIFQKFSEIYYPETEEKNMNHAKYNISVQHIIISAIFELTLKYYITKNINYVTIKID